MSYDDWKTRVPDDDPEDDYRWREERCPHCGASPDDPCTPECYCVYCRRRRALALLRERD